MSVLRKHGYAMGTLDAGYKKLVLMSDGTVHLNLGDGWHLYGNLRQGEDPAAVGRHWDQISNRPERVAFRRALEQVGCLRNRALFWEAYRLMPNDLDGVTGEVQDALGWGTVTFEDVQEIDRAWKALTAAFAAEKQGVQK